MNTIEVLKALADVTRLRMVSLLSTAGDLCACEIEAVLEINQSNASRHLSRLRGAGIIHAEKRGLWVHYRLSSGTDPEMEMESLVELVLDRARFDIVLLSGDLERLAHYRRSGFTCTTIAEWKGPEIPYTIKLP